MIPSRHVLKQVPLIQQKPRWCGYTCLAMMLQYCGYTNATPDLVFDTVHADAPLNDRFGQEAVVSIGELVKAGRQLAPNHRVDFLAGTHFIKLWAANYALPPQAVLGAYLSRGWPCLIRVPSHYIVVVGYDQPQGLFHYLNPALVALGMQTMTERQLLERWGTGDRSLTYDSRCLMLSIRPPR